MWIGYVRWWVRGLWAQDASRVDGGPGDGAEVWYITWERGPGPAMIGVVHVWVDA